MITAPAYSLVVVRTQAITGPNAGRVVPIVEIVVQPINTLDGETGRLNRQEAFRSLLSVLNRLNEAPWGTTIAEIFRDVPDAVPHRYAREPRCCATPIRAGPTRSCVR